MNANGTNVTNYKPDPTFWNFPFAGMWFFKGKNQNGRWLLGTILVAAGEYLVATLPITIDGSGFEP